VEILIKTGQASHSHQPQGISWPPLISGTLLRRYKRFIADVRLQNNTVIQAHCPNSGSMKGCSEPGRKVYLSKSPDPRRKLKYTWEMIRMPGSLVGINTLVPNRLVACSVASGQIEELAGYDFLRTEVVSGPNTRLDLRLTKKGGSACYVEVKNCTLVHDGVAYFPDAVTTRGLKHLHELEKLVQQGCRSAVFFVVQRSDAKRFHPADMIDPAYGRQLRAAVKNNVEIIAYDVHISLKGIALRKSVPWEL